MASLCGSERSNLSESVGKSGSTLTWPISRLTKKVLVQKNNGLKIVIFTTYSIDLYTGYLKSIFS